MTDEERGQLRALVAELRHAASLYGQVLERQGTFASSYREAGMFKAERELLQWIESHVSETLYR
jgi:hypothetical protein